MKAAVVQTNPKNNSIYIDVLDTKNKSEFISLLKNTIPIETSKAPNISYFVIKNEDVVFINLPLKTENKAAIKAEKTPYNIPSMYLNSKPKIISIPNNIKILITISIVEIFRLNIIGSIKATNKVVNDIQTTPIEIVLTLIE